MTDKPGTFYATYLPSNHEIIAHLQLKMYVYKINSNHILIFFYSQHYAKKCFFMAELKELMLSLEEF